MDTGRQQTSRGKNGTTVTESTSHIQSTSVTRYYPNNQCLAINTITRQLKLVRD